MSVSSSAGEVRKRGTINAEWAAERAGREWMSVAWRGRSDVSPPTVCHSGFPVMYGCCMAPLGQQNQSIRPCRGMLRRDNGGLWPLLWNDKTPWGWRGREWGWKGGRGCCFIQYHIVSSSVGAVEWWNTDKNILTNAGKSSFRSICDYAFWLIYNIPIWALYINQTLWYRTIKYWTCFHLSTVIKTEKSFDVWHLLHGAAIWQQLLYLNFTKRQ